CPGVLRPTRPSRQHACAPPWLATVVGYALAIAQPIPPTGSFPANPDLVGAQPVVRRDARRRCLRRLLAAIQIRAVVPAGQDRAACPEVGGISEALAESGLLAAALHRQH